MRQKKILFIIFNLIFCFQILPQDFSEGSVPIDSSNTERTVPIDSSEGSVPIDSSNTERSVPIDSENSSSPEEIIILPEITTYINQPVAEQKIVLEAEEIESLHVESLPELLQQSGIQILSYGAYGLQQTPSIRGFTDETVRVVIDGVCVNNPQYGTFDFTTLNILQIEKIEIIKGGFTEGVSDEGAVGGAIYITSRKNSLGTSFYSDSALKSFFNLNVPVDTFSEKLGFSSQVKNTFFSGNFSGTYANNKYYYLNYAKKKTAQENSKVKDLNGNFNLTQYFSDGSFLALSDTVYGGYKECPGSKTTINYGIQQDYNNNFTLNFTNPAVHNNFKWENTLAWLNTNRMYNSDSESSCHKINNVKFSSCADFYNLKQVRELCGLTLEYTYLNSTDDGIHNQFSGTFKETTKIKFNKILSLSVPLAVKFSGSNFAFIPKAGIKADFSNLNFPLQITTDIYRMVQFPNMDDLYWQSSGYSGNPDLIPESGYGADLGFFFSNSIFPFSITFFTNYYKNKIQWAQNENGWMPQNIASAFYAGIDFNNTKKLMGDRLTLFSNGEYLYTRLLDKSNKYTYGNRIMWTPDFTVFFSANYHFGSIDKNAGNVKIELNYMGKRYKSNMNGAFLPPYMLINLAADFPAGKYCIPYLRVDNLLNKSYESVDNYATPGTALAVGCKISL